MQICSHVQHIDSLGNEKKKSALRPTPRSSVTKLLDGGKDARMFGCQMLEFSKMKCPFVRPRGNPFTHNASPRHAFVVE
jgi:hypothetical protein